MFKLRQGVKFHNGQDFTAEDVKYTFDRILDPGHREQAAVPVFGHQGRDGRRPLHGAVRARRRPTRPSSTTSRRTRTGRSSRRASRTSATQPVGTGPFIFEAYQPSQQFSLTANPNYYEKGQPHLSKVVFKFYKDQATLSSALRSKAIDMTWLKDPKVAALMARTSPDLVSAPGQTSRTFPVWLNMKAKPLDDVRVRRALSLATDRKACLDTVLGGAGKVGAMIPESQVGGYDGVGEMPYYKHDPAAAKKLLAEAGYPDGIDLGNYIVVAANPLDVACAQILQQQWQAAGIKVKITPMETAPLLNMWRSRDLADAPVRRAFLDARCGRDLPVREVGQQVRHRHGHQGPRPRPDDRRGSRRPRPGEPRRQEPRRSSGISRTTRTSSRSTSIRCAGRSGGTTSKGYVPLAANIRSFVRTTSLKK